MCVSQYTTMEALAELNTLAASTDLPTRPLRELPIGQAIAIAGVKRVTTRFGKRLLVTCPDYVVFLPDRYASVSDSTVAACNAGGFSLVYLGELNGSSQVRFTSSSATP